MTIEAPNMQNRIHCLCCDQIAVSTHRHDYQVLPNCRNRSMVDGGLDYCRIGGKDMTLVETWNAKEQKWNESDNQFARDLFQNNKYDHLHWTDGYPNKHTFAEYLDSIEKAQKSFQEDLFKHHGLELGSVQPEALFWAVMHMPFETSRDPDLKNVYFLFSHFRNVMKG